MYVACADHSAVECLMRLLICLMEAEAAYSAAMATAAKTASAGPLTAPSDSSNLLAALEGMVALPAAAAAGHRQLYLELQVRGTCSQRTLLQSLYSCRWWMGQLWPKSLFLCTTAREQRRSQATLRWQAYVW